jgi:AraC family transcriptional regulator
MPQKLAMQSVPALAAIDAFMRGPSMRLYSSSALGWDGVQLEHHRVYPLERSESVSTHHVIVLFTSHVSRMECTIAPGRYVPSAYFPGEMKLFPAGPLGGCRSFGDTTMIVCALDPKLVAEVGEESGRPRTAELRPISNLRDRSLESIVTLLAVEADAGGISGRLYAEELARALVVRFRHLSSGTRAIGASRGWKMPARTLQRVLDRMKADFASDLDLKTIAAESGYSKSHFLRMFRASVGFSPHQWLIRLRIEEAKALLQKTSSSLTDIALRCGFSSHAHFSGTFRQIVGVIPSEYRRNYNLIL